MGADDIFDIVGDVLEALLDGFGTFAERRRDRRAGRRTDVGYGKAKKEKKTKKDKDRGGPGQQRDDDPLRLRHRERL